MIPLPGQSAAGVHPDHVLAGSGDRLRQLIRQPDEQSTLDVPGDIALLWHSLLSLLSLPLRRTEVSAARPEDNKSIPPGAREGIAALGRWDLDERAGTGTCGDLAACRRAPRGIIEIG